MSFILLIQPKKNTLYKIQNKKVVDEYVVEDKAGVDEIRGNKSVIVVMDDQSVGCKALEALPTARNRFARKGLQKRLQQQYLRQFLPRYTVGVIRHNIMYMAKLPEPFQGLQDVSAITIAPLLLPKIGEDALYVVRSEEQYRFSYFKDQVLLFTRLAAPQIEYQRELQDTLNYCRQYFSSQKKNVIEENIKNQDYALAAIDKNITALKAGDQKKQTKKSLGMEIWLSLLAVPLFFLWLGWQYYQMQSEQKKFRVQLQRQQAVHRNFLSERFPDTINPQIAFEKQLLIDNLYNRQLELSTVMQPFKKITGAGYLFNSLSLNKPSIMKNSFDRSQSGELQFGEQSFDITTPTRFDGRAELIMAENAQNLKSLEFKDFNLIFDNDPENVWGSDDIKSKIIQFEGSFEKDQESINKDIPQKEPLDVAL